MRLPQQPLEGGDEGAELGVDAVAEQRGVRQDRHGGVPQLGAPRHGDRLAQQPLDLRGEVGLHPGDDDQERDGDAQDGRAPHGEQTARAQVQAHRQVDDRHDGGADPGRGDMQRDDLHDPAGDRQDRPPAPAPAGAGVVQQGQEDRGEHAVGHAGADAQEVGGLGEELVLPPGGHRARARHDHDVVDEQVDEQQVRQHPQEPPALLTAVPGVQLDEHEDGQLAERHIAPVEQVAVAVDRRQEGGQAVEDEQDDGRGQRYAPHDVEVDQPGEDHRRQDLHHGGQGRGLADHDGPHEHEAHRHQPEVAQRVAPPQQVGVQHGGQRPAHRAQGVLSDRGQRTSPSSPLRSRATTSAPPRRSASRTGPGRRRWRRSPRRPRRRRPRRGRR